MSESSLNLEESREAVVIDIDDTIIDLGQRRAALFKQHFPKIEDSTLKNVRTDPTLSSIPERYRDPKFIQDYLRDFADPDKVAELEVGVVDGAIEAINALEESGLEVILLTGRPKKLRDMTKSDLKEVGLDWTGKQLIMAEETISPEDGEGFRSYKRDALIRLGERRDIVAVVGNGASDITAAFDANIPAILLCVPPLVKPSEDFKDMANVGYYHCKSWAQALVKIGTFRTGEEQLLELRDSFTAAYTSWLRNLNHLCAIDVTIASLLATLSGAAILESSLSTLSRVLVLIPLILSLIALIFAIRSFTSKYSSGGKASRSVLTISKQWFNIFFDKGGPLDKARHGDAIHKYFELRDKDTAMQANAHRQFFYSRYEAHNPRALMNLRMYEMRMLNIVRAYAEHLASRTLVWAATSLVIWAVLVAFLDASIVQNQSRSAQEVEQRQVDSRVNNDSISPGAADQE